MKYQIFTIYLLFLLLTTILISKWLVLTISPLILFLYKLAIKEYESDRRAILNFFIVPLLNLLSIYIISLLFGYNKYLARSR